jgi:hypothetical protein
MTLCRRRTLPRGAASSGRSAHTPYGGHDHVLRQTLIVLTVGKRL